MKIPSVACKSVLVTGASSGIGWGTAHYLRAADWLVIPTARKAEDLARLRAEGFQPVALDLNDSASIRAAVDETLKLAGGHLGGLVNNAGYGQPGAIEDLSREVIRRQFETNVFGLQELTNLLLPLFRRQGFGRVVNVSSVLGRIVTPFMGAYAASKYAVEALSDALRVELRGSGVAVALVEPGPIESAFRARALAEAESGLDPHRAQFGEIYARQIRERKQRQGPSEAFTRGPEAVARKIRHALESPCPRARYPVTLPAYLGDALGRWLPVRLRDYLLARRVAGQKAWAEGKAG